MYWSAKTPEEKKKYKLKQILVQLIAVRKQNVS